MNLTDMPLPYSIRNDSFFTLILFVCFFVISFILKDCRDLIIERTKNFIYDHKRNNLFETTINNEWLVGGILILQTGVLSAIIMLGASLHKDPLMPSHTDPKLLFAAYTAAFIAFITFKFMMYRFIGWIFYDKEKTKIWTETYSTFIYCSGMILFPFTLLDIYFRLPPAFMTIIAIILLASIKLLSLYKWNRLFFNKKHSYVRLILYFCSLEIIPCLLAYKGIFLIEKIS